MTKLRTVLPVAAVALAMMAAPSLAGQVHVDLPDKIDTEERYLIYLHGGRPESFPLSEPHQSFGLFEYDAITVSLALRDFQVISELRTERTNPRKYVRERVIPQINTLIEKGVTPQQITVVGFSKGGSMSLITAALAKQPGLNIVNLAGCGTGKFRRSYDNFLNNDAPKMQGRMLSLVDEKDTIAGTCEEAAAKAPRLNFTEQMLKVGAGHGTFYAANPTWLDIVAAWAKETPATN